MCLNKAVFFKHGDRSASLLRRNSRRQTGSACADNYDIVFVGSFFRSRTQPNGRHRSDRLIRCAGFFYRFLHNPLDAVRRYRRAGEHGNQFLKKGFDIT